MVTFPPRLNGLLDLVRTSFPGRPERAIGALRQLLGQCQGPDQLAYAYEQLGFAHLLLGEHRLSEVFYEKALSIDPGNVYALANLAHAVHELGETERAVALGRRALRLKDEAATAAGAPAAGRPHGGAKDLISFSLFGDRARYCEMALLNCEAAALHLPGFVCRFHVDATVPDTLLRRLRERGAEVVTVSGPAAGFPGTFWRFLPLDDADLDRVVVRDVDSLVDAREAWCVEEWTRSGKPFHVIRDDCCHTELILAGLFAARSGVVRDVAGRIAGFIKSLGGQPPGRYADQLFLRTWVWPAVRGGIVTHDTVYGFGDDVRDVPADVGRGSLSIRNAFMGANHANYVVRCQSPDPFPPGVQHRFRIVADGGAEVCEYGMDRTGDRDLEIALPLSYRAKLESGAWRSEIVAVDPRDGRRTVIGGTT